MPTIMSKEIRIDLGAHKKPSATAFTGRPQGREARNVLNLDTKDATGEKVCFVLPSDTTSFNPSFFLGLLYDSYKYYQGSQDFDEHYRFDLSNLPTQFQTVIQKNLDDGKRNAANSLNNRTVLNFL